MDTLEMNYEGKLVRNGKPVDFDETTTEERKKVFVNELMRIELKLHYLTFINHSAYGVEGVTLHEVLPISELDAQLVMLEAHKTGSSIALTEPLEHAELHREQLLAKFIVSTIEPA